MDSPKTRFLKTGIATSAAEIMVSPAMTAAADVALLQFVIQLPSAADMTEAARNELKLEGAKSFLYELLTIATPTVERKPASVTRNLEP